MNILIVDDEHRFRQTLMKHLKRKGINANGAASGEEALEELKKNSYDVVLLDLKMSGMSGIDVLKRIREQGNRAEVVILSGHALVESAMAATDFGAFDYLLKPCDVEIIYDKMISAYERKQEKEKALANKVQSKR
ncbi:MAG: response regulator [Desulfobacterales bacterium]|nr:response regulator [Desulfobacterales bacterium]